jgi:hypothetical protein
MTRAGERALETAGHVPRSRAHGHENGPRDLEPLDLADQETLQRAGAAPPPVDEREVLERAGHLLGRDLGVVEDLSRGLPPRNEETQFPRDTTRALFFDPNPMQLQSACSKEAARDSFAT